MHTKGNCSTSVGDGAKLLYYTRGHPRVQACGGLIEAQDGRRTHKCTSDAEPLTLTSRNATVVNIAVVPPALRVLYVNAVFFCWAIFLSLVVNKQAEQGSFELVGEGELASRS